MKPSTARARILRLLLLVAGLVAIYLAAASAGVLDDLTIEGVRDRVLAAGAWGALAYLLAFFVGVLFYIPGMLFIAAGILAYGKAMGASLALLGAVSSASLSVAFLRMVGGNLLAEIDRPIVVRILSHLHDRPIRTVAALRLIMWVSPPLNTALALSGVRQREHLIGTILGLTPVVLGVALTLESILAGAGIR